MSVEVKIMNCEFIEQNINELCDQTAIGQEISAEQQKQALEHIETCQHCKIAMAEHQEYLLTMRQFTAPNLEAGVSAKLLRNAKSQPAPQHHNFGFMKGFIAASVFFVALFSAWQFNHSDTAAIPQLVSSEGFSTEVTLVIYVPEDMPNADLKITLPDNVQLAGLNDLDSFSWPVDLKQGANTLSLPIEVAAGMDLNKALSFMANINYKNKQKDFELKVNLITPQVQTQSSVNSATLHSTTV